MPRLSRYLAPLLALLWAVSATAGPRNDALTAAFEGWMAETGFTSGAIAVIEAGTPYAQGYGDTRPDQPVALASLSKAITAACVAALDKNGVFDLDADIATLLDLPGAAGRLSEFLTHSAGLAPDRTQGIPWHLDADRTPRHQIAAQTALAAPRKSPDFRYSNENYAVLGAVLDAQTQTDYATGCARLVLAPSGIKSAALDPVWGPHGAWGGWSMSVRDYARFVQAWFGDGGGYAQDPLAWPHATLGNSRYYIMGAFHRPRRGENLFWHAGQLCWNGAGDGSYFASYGGDPVVVVSFKGCASDDAFQALSRALFQAGVN
ncbi:MAG: serine hydrolase [Litoreibacter sp.]|nr:serine hydrolase [Litoreibacter sp.]MCY4333229.1 serine hydrolase [Litoreibacter sp.]